MVAPTGGAPGRIEGIVRDVVTGEPVPYVDVLFSRPTGEISANSGTDGYYQAELPVGEYAVRATGDGVLGARLPALSVWRVGQQIRLDVAVRRVATVRGRVVDARGNAVGAARVSVRLSEAIREGHVRSGELSAAVDAGADGRFELQVIPGDVELDAVDGARAGYAYLPGVFPGTVRDVEIALEPGVTVSGIVREPGGAPVSGARVDAFTLTDTNARDSAEATSDSGGRFSFDSVRSGRVIVEARLSPHAPSKPFHFELAPGAEQHDIELVLQPAQAVTGTVVDAAGKPVADAVVKAKRVGSWMAPQRTRTGEDGAFEIPELDRGKYAITASKQGFGWQRVRDVRPPATGLRLVLHENGGIRGTVTGGDGAPVASFGVRIEQFVAADSDVRRRPGTTTQFLSDNGRFEIPDLAPGRYDLAVTADGFAPGRVAVEVPSGAFGDGSVALAGGADVTGGVTDAATGAAIAGASVSMPRGSASTAYTGADGAFRLANVAPGTHTLVVAHPDYEPMRRGGVAAGAPVAVELTPRDGADDDDRQVEGIGIVIEDRKAGVRIRSVVPGSPAAAAGVRAGDRVVSVNGQDVTGLRHEEVADRIRGPAGTTVHLVLSRGGADIDRDITRGRVSHGRLLLGIIASYRGAERMSHTRRATLWTFQRQIRAS